MVGRHDPVVVVAVAGPANHYTPFAKAAAIVSMRAEFKRLLAQEAFDRVPGLSHADCLALCSCAHNSIGGESMGTIGTNGTGN
jgi:hypothetical protein